MAEKKWYQPKTFFIVILIGNGHYEEDTVEEAQTRALWARDFGYNVRTYMDTRNYTYYGE